MHHLWLIEMTIYLIGGALAGFLAGLLGIGGGLLVVPFLALVLPITAHVPADITMHFAVATSLAIVVGTSSSSVVAHYLHGGIRWDIFKRLLLGIILGAVVAANIADSLPSNGLRIVFGVFVIALASSMLIKIKSLQQNERPLPGRVGLFFSSFTISGFCNLIGLGGGSLLVPFFNYFKLPMRQAIATSAACGFPIALAGVISLMVVGSDEPGLPQWSTGFVYWPACIAMVIPSILIAPFGANLTHRLSADKLRRIFAVFLIIVGVDMLLKALFPGLPYA